MKKIITLLLILFTMNSFAAIDDVGKKKIQFKTSQPDAEIFLNGRKIGTGSAIVTVPKDNCIYVVAKKIGFLTEKIEFCNSKEVEKLPKVYTLNMREDDAYINTENSGEINRDLLLPCKRLSKDEAWKTINQILLSYVDVIALMDKETGYLRTEWTVNSFTQNTLRTRFIVKESSANPLVFKVKVVSEQSGQTLTNITNDQLFKPWDRVLKQYTNAIEELKARIK